ncbi:MAG: hypothetical protein Q4F31_00565 [Eubacteriales bacterium]|nr:hypothetical protein [Eubacteriales bacterium]
MALDRNYFNSIDLNPVKKKFYDITAVDNLLVDIRKQAELINHRYEDMQSELDNAKSSRDDYKVKGQALSQEIVVLRNELEGLKNRAGKAEMRVQELEELLSRNEKNHDSLADEKSDETATGYGLERIEEMVNSMKNIYLSGIETLDKQWQDFKEDTSSELILPDISGKVGKIAETLMEINKEI